MLRSLFTAITALSLHQQYLDVVADNLANVNTPGFKSSRVMFQDLFSQLMSPGSAPTEQVGGINPTQVGLGLRIGYITPSFTQGTLNSTGRTSDLAIQGDGFFIYRNGEGREVYGREASLQIDSEGYLVNASTGYRLQGWNADPTSGEVDPNWPLEDLRIPLDRSTASATTKIALGNNLNSTTDPSSVDNYYDVTIGFYDSLGSEQTTTLRFTRINAGTGFGSDPGNGIYTSDWQISIAPDPATGNPPAGHSISPNPSTVTFDSSGQLAYVDGVAVTDAALAYPEVTVAGENGAADTTWELDLSNVTQLSQSFTISMTQRNGSSTGAVTDIHIAADSGEIYVLYSNGTQEKLGQLGMARFTNPSGLIRLGRNQYNVGINSGPPIVGAPNTGGRGTVNAGYLEGSNVDLGQEFTNMILAQRGFQASARVINTGDQILMELTNLKRM